MTDRAPPQLFFFYGTLIAGSANEAAHAAHTRLRPAGPASVPGALWALPDPAGWYPALVGGSGAVRGMLYAAAPIFDAADLARIDRWEDYFPDRPAGSQYRREREIVVDPAGGEHRAWLYRYNRPLPAAAVAIADGDFARWLATYRLSAYAP